MAANAVSSGRQLTDKCLPEYISTAMKTKDFFRGGGLGKGAARHNQEGRKVWKALSVLPHVPKAIRAVAQSGFS